MLIFNVNFIKIIFNSNQIKMEPILNNLRTVCNHSSMFGRREEVITIINREQTEMNIRLESIKQGVSYQLASKQRQISDLNIKLKDVHIELNLTNKKVSDLEYTNKKLSEKAHEWEVKHQKVKTQLHLVTQKMLDLQYSSKTSYTKPCQWQINYQEINTKVTHWERKYSEINNQLILENKKVFELEKNNQELSFKLSDWQRKYSEIHNQLISANSRVQGLSVKVNQWQQHYNQIKIQLNLTINNLEQQITILENQKVSEKGEWQRKYTEINNQFILVNKRVQELEFLYSQSSAQLIQWQQNYKKIQIQLNVTIQKYNSQITILQNNQIREWQRKYTEINNQFILVNKRVQELEFLYSQSSAQLIQWQQNYKKIQIQLNVTIQKYNSQITILQNNQIREWQRKYTEINNQFILVNKRVQELEFLYSQSSAQLIQWQQNYKKIQIQLNVTIQKYNSQITILQNNQIREWQRKYTEINNQFILVNKRVQELEFLYSQSSAQLIQWQQNYKKIQIQLNVTIQKYNSQITILQNNQIREWQRKYTEINNQFILVNSRVQELEFLYSQSCAQLIQWQQKYKKIEIQLNQSNQNSNQKITILINQKVTEHQLIIQELTTKFTIQKQSYQEFTVKLNNRISELELQIKNLYSQIESKQLSFNNICIELTKLNEKMTKRQKQYEQLYENYSKILQQYNQLIQQHHRMSQTVIISQEIIKEKSTTQTTIEGQVLVSVQNGSVGSITLENNDALVPL